MSLVLDQYLIDLYNALYKEQSEATCCIAIDLILIQYQKYIKNKYYPTKTKTAFNTALSTPMKNTFNSLARILTKPIKLYSEPTISVEVPNQSAPNKKFLVTGRTDWAVGYSSKEDGALLVALEAKQRTEFSSSKSQLLAYLAILWENRHKSGKTNIITQGFYSDGACFAFIYIDNGGSVVQSLTWDIEAEGDLDMVFSFIIAMFESALKSTPTAIPTKSGKQQNKEIQDFGDKVWSKVYSCLDKSLEVSDGSDDNMDNLSKLYKAINAG